MNRRILTTLLVAVLLLSVAGRAPAVVLNVAPEGLSTQSTVGWGGVPAAALDGNLGNFTHTASADLTPWWEVDLMRDRLIEEINFYNRTSCCGERLYNLTWEIRDGLDAVLYTSTEFNPWDGVTPDPNTPPDPGLGPFTIDLSGQPGGGVAGQKLRVSKAGFTGTEWLSLAEVEVMADVAINAALGAPVTATGPVYAGWDPGGIVDGRLAGQVHSDAGVTTYAYEIDLGDSIAPESINVWGRQDDCCPARLADYRVSLHQDDDGAIGAEVWSAELLGQGSVLGAPDTFLAGDGVGTFEGQWLRIDRIDDTLPDDFVLQIAEVEALLGDRPDLAWDGAGPGNWSSTTQWTGGAGGEVPDYFTHTTVQADLVTLTESAGARTMTVTDGGGVAINSDQKLKVREEASLASGTALSVGSNAAFLSRGPVNFAAGSTVDLGAGATLAADGGSIHAVTAAGDATISTSAGLAITTLTAAAGTITKQDVGTLSLDNASGDGVVVTADTIIRIEQGTLRARGAAPLGDSRAVELAGGALELIGGGLLSGVSAFYTFDDDANPTNDDSGNGHTGALSVEAAWADTGKVGGGLALAGVNGKMTVDPVIDLSDEWTVASWYKDRALGQDWNTMFRGISADHMIIVNVAGELGVYQSSGVGGGFRGAGFDMTALDDGQWHHLAAVGSGSSTDLYVDGAHVGTSDRKSETDVHGIGNIGGVDNPQRFSDLIDEAFIFARPLEPSEITALFDAGATGDYGTIELPDMSATTVTVSADSAINAPTLPGVSFASLTLQEGLLGVSAGPGGIGFAGGTTIDAAADAVVGVNLQTGIELGRIDAVNPVPVTFAKTGPVDLVMTAANVGNGFENLTFEAREGRLIGLHGSNPFDVAALGVSHGELVLSSAGGDVTYDNLLTATGDGMLTAAPAGGGVDEQLTVTLGSAPEKGLVMDVAAALELRSTGQYTLEVAGPLDGPEAAVRVTEGAVVLSGGGIVGSVTATGGSLTTAAAIDVATMRVASGAVVDTAGNGVTISDGLKLLQTDFEISQGDTFSVAGSDLLAEAEITLGGGTLAISGAIAFPSDGLEARFDAGAGVEAAGGIVQSWADQSVGGNHATLAGGDPVLVEDQLNGLPVVQFRGNDDWLDVPNEFYARQIYCVFRSPNPAFSYYGSVFGGDEYNDNLGRTFIFENGQTYLHWNPFPAGVRKNGVPLVENYDLAPIDEWMVLAVDTANPDELRSYRIGRTDNYGAEIDVAEILVFNRLLSEDEENSVGGYLATKYGLDTDYPPVPGTGGVDQETTDFLVTADSTLQLNTVIGATLGDLTLAAGVRLDVTGAEVVFQDVDAGHDATIAGTVALDGEINAGASAGVLIIDGFLEFGENGVYQCEIDQWDSENVPDPWNPSPPPAISNKQGPVNDKIQVTFGDALLGGGLELKALAKLSPAHELPGQPGVMVEWYGDQTRTIITTQGESTVQFSFDAVTDPQPEVYDLPGTGNWGQGHIGHGAFLTRISGDDPVVHPGITYEPNFTQLHLFQAADGDTNGDRRLGSLDIQAILSANTFPDVQPTDWVGGDFTGDGWCNGLDIQALLATGLYPFLPGPYAAVDPGEPGDQVVDLLLYAKDFEGNEEYPPGEAGMLMVSTGDVTINGYVIRSAAGVFTGEPMTSVGDWFVEDTDRQISDNMGFQLTGLHNLGKVVGPEWEIVGPVGKGGPVNPYDDLTFTYTIVGVPGTFVGHLIVVPEPGTMAMLAAVVLGLLAWAARRRLSSH